MRDIDDKVARIRRCKRQDLGTNLPGPAKNYGCAVDRPSPYNWIRSEKTLP